MKRVTEIGGIFFKSDNPDQLYKWYEKHLGITRGPHGEGVMFRWSESQDAGDKDSAEGMTAWAIFPKSTKYFDPSPDGNRIELWEPPKGKKQ